MNATLLMAAWLIPLLVLPLALRASGRWWVPLAAVPALAAALLVPVGTAIDLPWLLLGIRLGLSPHDQVFLLFGATLWLLAGWYAAIHLCADAQAGRFRAFFLLAMSGNFALIVGQDLVSFYLGFSVMGLAAYGLVVHEGNAVVRRAGRIYLVMTLIGEVALFAGLAFLYLRVGSLVPTPATLVGGGAWELGLLSLGFAIKAGLIGLHFWLPLAHPAAPIAASAVLSGAMIKAALVGWLRYLPLGQQAMPGLGEVFIVVGVATALSAFVLGIGQRDPKVVLAYSSIGKMGTLVAGLGVAAHEPALAPAIIVALTFYAAHHGLAKGALFLSVGVVKSSRSRWPLWAAAVPALALIGMPFTSGALAKQQYKAAVLQAPSGSTDLIALALPLIALGTTLLMARYLYLLSRSVATAPDEQPTLAVPWVGLVALSVGLPLLAAGAAGFVATDLTALLIGASLAIVVAMKRPARLSSLIGRIPPGDLVVPLESIAQRISAWLSGLAKTVFKVFGGPIAKRPTGDTGWVSRLTATAESALAENAASGAAWLALAGTTFALLVWP